MGVSLYEISGKYLELLDAYTDPELAAQEDVDLEQAFLDTLEGLEGEFQAKAINVAKYMLHLESLAEAIKEAERRQKARRELVERRAVQMRQYLIRQLEVTGLSKVEDAYLKLSLAKLPPSVEILDEAKVPGEFFIEKITRTVSKTAIKEAGGCPGAKIVTGAHRLVVR